MSQVIRLGTRGSELALYQTYWVEERLKKYFPDTSTEIVVIKTTGDKILDSPLSRIGDKGLFTRELDRALIEKEIDLAVHSMKDVPTQFDDRLTIAAVTERWDVRDAFIARSVKHLRELPDGATVATGSLRRKAQLLHFRPDLKIIDIRGNVNTRLKKFDASNWDAMILACAGLERLNLQNRIKEKIDVDIILPAVGQGCFAVMSRKNDQKVLKIARVLNRPEVEVAVKAERALLKTIEGGCQVPLGALGRVENQHIRLKGCIASLDGKKYFIDEAVSSLLEPEEAGIWIALSLVIKRRKWK